MISAIKRRSLINLAVKNKIRPRLFRHLPKKCQVEIAMQWLVYSSNFVYIGIDDLTLIYHNCV